MKKPELKNLMRQSLSLSEVESFKEVESFIVLATFRSKICCVIAVNFQFTINNETCRRIIPMKYDC